MIAKSHSTQSSRRAVIHSNSRSGYDLNTRDTGLTGGEYSGTGSGLAGTTGAGYDSTARDTGSGLLGGDSVLGSGTGPDASPSIQEKNAQSVRSLLESSETIADFINRHSICWKRLSKQMSTSSVLIRSKNYEATWSDIIGVIFIFKGQETL